MSYLAAMLLLSLDTFQVIVESCHTNEWVMAHERVSHGTHVNCVTRMNMSWCAGQGVMSPMCMCHVTHMNDWRLCYSIPSIPFKLSLIHVMYISESWRTCGSCHTYECVMLRMFRSHVTHVHESCGTNEWVAAMLFFFHSIYFRLFVVSCHSNEWVMAHMTCSLSLSYVTHIIESWHTCGSCHTYECVVLRMFRSHVTLVNGTSSCDLFVYGTCPIYT